MFEKPKRIPARHSGCGGDPREGDMTRGKEPHPDVTLSRSFVHHALTRRDLAIQRAQAAVRAKFDAEWQAALGPNSKKAGAPQA